MDTYSLLAIGLIVVLVLTLAILFIVFRILIKRQIDEQMKDIIPIKIIRERIQIRIKLRNHQNR